MEDTSLLKKITEYWILLTTSLIFISFSGMYYYYQAFNIDISQFIETSEILLSGFSIVNQTLIWCLIVFRIALDKDFTIEHLDIQLEQKFIRISDFLGKHIIMCLIIVLVIPIIVLLAFLIKGNVKYFKAETYFEPYTTFLICIWTVLAILYSTSRLNYYRNKLFFSFVIVLFLSQFSAVYNMTKGLMIRYNYYSFSQVDVKFRYFDEQITSNLNFKYIGGTRNYMFLRDSKTRSTYVFGKSDITNLIFLVP